MNLRVGPAARAICAPDWSWDSTISPFSHCNLWLVISGRGRVISGESSFPLRRGDCFVHRSSERQRGEHDSRHPLIVPFITFDLLDEQGVPLPHGADFPLPLHRRVADPDFLAALMQRVINGVAAGRGDHDETKRWLFCALSEYLENSVPGVEEVQEGERQRVRMEGIAKGLRDGQRYQVRVEELAREADCSVDHFIRLFRRALGVTPGEYLIRLRIEEAKALLTFSSQPISRVAELLGYPDLYSFSRQFKSRTALSPTCYREAASRSIRIDLKRIGDSC